MSRVFKATGTITAYFVTDETDIDRIREISREVIAGTVEYYGEEEAIVLRTEEMHGDSSIPIEDRDKYVFVRSKKYEEDDEMTVEEALEDA